MKLSQIRSFLAVAERGSVQGAARQLGITQPAVTRSIHDLERALGAPLFQRSGTGMTLTSIGKAVLRRAGGVQAELDRIQDEVAQLAGRQSGTVAVGLSFVAHAGLLPKVIGPFRRQAPEVQLEIREALFSQVEADIHAGSIDFYVGPMLPEQSFHGVLSIEPLFKNWRQIYCRRGHPLANAGSLSDLEGADWITTSSASNSTNELALLFKHYGLPPPHVAVKAQSMLSMTFIVGSSDLLAAIPRQFQQLLSIRSTLARIPVSEQLYSTTICIVKRASVPLTPAAEKLSDMFRRAAIAHAGTLPDTPSLTR